MHHCPGCGAKFVGAEQFCPYDGMQVVSTSADDFGEGMPSLAGVKVGNYILREKIGHGGMGEVWRAEHPGIGRVVAIKILNADAANQPEAVERFFLEAKAANRIRHPNLIDIVDLGVLPSGQCYCVMEYLQGQDLSQVLRDRGRVPFFEALPWFLQLLDGLQAIHSQRILHRDLKPENVFLAQDPHRGTLVKILDFGVAKLMQSSQALTRVGVAMGTPMFMSPEQASGQKLDGRSDLYAVGVLLYVTVTGRYPFTGTTPMRILEKTVSEPPIPPREVFPEIDPQLEALILRALEKEKDKRFADAHEMSQALQSLMGGSVLAEVAPDRGRGRRWAAIGVAAGASIAAVLALLVLGDVVPTAAVWGASQEQGPEAQAASQEAPGAREYSLEISTKPQGAEIFRGEAALGMAPGVFVVSPGERLKFRAPGFQEKEVEVPQKGPLKIALEPLPDAPKAIIPPPPAPESIEEPPAPAPEKPASVKSPPRNNNNNKKINQKKGPIGGLDG